MPFELESHTGILIKKAARLFERVANKDLEELGVTYSQTTFLIRLWEKDGQTQVELARNAGIQQPSVVRILDRMERDNLIIRQINKKDRRSFNFFLTEKAKLICQKLEMYANSMHDIATVTISKKEIQEINKLLTVIINNLQKFLKE